MNCKHCHCPIARGEHIWYHVNTGMARCYDNASFIFAEPK